MRRRKAIDGSAGLSQLGIDAAPMAGGPIQRASDPTLDDDRSVDGPVGRDRQFVTALARGLDILRVFRPGDGPLGNQEIAQRTGLPKPTVSRLTYTLTRLGHLVYLERLGKYQIGLGVLTLGHVALGAMSVRHLARQHMQALADHTDLPVALGTRDRLSMIYAEACRSRDTVSLRYDIGTRIPIAVTAMGRAYLAALPERERGYLMGHLEQRYGARWPEVRHGIDKAMREIAEHGFCCSLAEWQADVFAVAAPMRMPDGSGLMAINCGGPGFLTNVKRLTDDIGPRLVNLVRTVETSAGGS
jgi:DNA-binding IclR family transcriptional regulator